MVHSPSVPGGFGVPMRASATIGAPASTPLVSARWPAGLQAANPRLTATAKQIEDFIPRRSETRTDSKLFSLVRARVGGSSPGGLSLMKTPGRLERRLIPCRCHDLLRERVCSVTPVSPVVQKSSIHLIDHGGHGGHGEIAFRGLHP